MIMNYYKIILIIIIIIIIITRLTSCLVLSTLAWVRTCQTISHEMRNCKSVLGLQLGYTRLPVWTLIGAEGLRLYFTAGCLSCHKQSLRSLCRTHGGTWRVYEPDITGHWAS